MWLRGLFIMALTFTNATAAMPASPPRPKDHVGFLCLRAPLYTARKAMRAANDNAMRRLLTKGQAAAYCGVSTSTFSSICPVRAISLGVGVRMERYDLNALDEWIDRLSGSVETVRTADQLLNAL
jgi:hypothetical protein